MSLIKATVGKVQRSEQVPDWMKRAFMSIRITWLMEASEQEILNLKAAENIEQHERQRHFDLANWFQVEAWMDQCAKWSNGKLDKTKPLDVFKYLLIMDDPTQPFVVQTWLANLVGNTKAKSRENKLAAVTAREVTLKFL